MGHTPYLLKPNLSTLYSSTKKDTHIDSVSGNILTLNDNYASDADIKVGLTGTTVTWLVLTNGTYSGYHWLVIAKGTSTVTIDGSPPAIAGGTTCSLYYLVVDARCAWTDPATITYIPLATNTSVTDEFTSKLNIIRYTNAGHFAINLKKTESTKVFPLGYKGNLPTNENVSGAAATGSIASQMLRAINYAMLYWPSTSPKYSNIFWYNGSYRSSHRDVYDVATTAWRMERCYMLKLAKEEDVYNNLFLKSLAVELV